VIPASVAGSLPAVAIAVGAGAVGVLARAEDTASAMIGPAIPTWFQRQAVKDVRRNSRMGPDG
jgi:hypothetical protein